MRTLLTFILLTVISVASYSSNDDPDRYTNADLVGTWVLQSMTPKEVETNNDEATQEVKDHIKNQSEKVAGKMILKFAHSGELIIQEDDDTYDGVYRVDGNKVIISAEKKIQEFEIVMISDNILALEFNMTDFYAEIIRISYYSYNVSKATTLFTLKKEEK